MPFPRRSGVLLHPTALPGRFGIGDLGDSAYAFADFLAAARQTYWQMLPLSPTGYGDSPYQGLSVFAGNAMLISPQRLLAAGHLVEADLAHTPPFPDDAVDFEAAVAYKNRLLDRACARFQIEASPAQRDEYEQFTRGHASWLDDFALFVALTEHYSRTPWPQWERGIARREPAALAHWRERLAGRIAVHKYRQWQFFQQWLALKSYVNKRGIRIIGDLPLYVGLDSADVWVNPHLFLMDADYHPTVLSGVPPDYFSQTGQLWGHPIYRWDVMAQDGFAWWVNRFKMAFTQSDIVRIDHFRGFHNYWEVPAGESTAMNGCWRMGPGPGFFRAVTAQLGRVDIIAEDLGEIDAASRAGLDAIQDEFGYPGMKVLQFAFGGKPSDLFLPHHYTPQCVAYTGTHDNDTSVGWYQRAGAHVQDFCRRYLARAGTDIAWDLIRLAWSSLAQTAITTAQDLLSLDSASRFNTPGTSGPPNWRWRVLPGQLHPDIASRLAELTYLYSRTPDEAAA